MRVAVSPRAKKSLAAIVEYRWTVAGANSALALQASFANALELLGRHPGIGRPRRDLTLRPLLFWPNENYWIVYRVKPRLESIEIVAILDARRDIGRLLR